MSKLDQSCHAVYRGDEFIDLGTLEELSQKLNMTRKFLQWLKSPTARNRINGNKNGLIVIKIEEDDGETYE